MPRYYTWVDHHNTLGLGENIPISTANLNDGFAALKDGQMVMLRIPYPLSFFAKGLDGRIARHHNSRSALAKALCEHFDPLCVTLDNMKAGRIGLRTVAGSERL